MLHVNVEIDVIVPARMSLSSHSQSVQSRKLGRCCKKLFVTDQITYPHFSANSKKTIMVLFSGVMQDH